MDTFIITDGVEFLGSNLAIHIRKTWPNNEVIVFNNLRRRCNELNLKQF